LGAPCPSCWSSFHVGVPLQFVEEDSESSEYEPTDANDSEDESDGSDSELDERAMNWRATKAAWRAFKGPLPPIMPTPLACQDISIAWLNDLLPANK
jgi:hypothetical protein